MTTVHVMTGLPGSGKSTLAYELVSQKPNTVRVSLDDYRNMMGSYPQYWEKWQEDTALKWMIRDLTWAVDHGRNVVVDNTHLRQRIPELIRRALAARKVQYEVCDLTDVPLDECVKRDAARPEPVGAAVIRRMWDRHQSARRLWQLTPEWLSQYGAELGRIQPYKPEAGALGTWLFDIDGTLAHAAHRGPYDFEQCETDEPKSAQVALAWALHDTGHTIVLLSGRQSEVRAHTQRWLSEYNVPYEALFMRPEGDRDPDFMVKARLFEQYVRPRYPDVRGIVDDRDQVVDVWRLIYGLPCLQADYGDF